MNKSELVSAIAQKSGLTKKDAQAALEGAIESIVESLKSGENVTLMGFGSFSTVERNARIGRNPKTGIAVEIKPKKLPFFKPGKDFKEYLNK